MGSTTAYNVMVTGALCFVVAVPGAGALSLYKGRDNIEHGPLARQVGGAGNYVLVLWTVFRYRVLSVPGGDATVEYGSMNYVACSDWRVWRVLRHLLVCAVTHFFDRG